MVMGMAEYLYVVKDRQTGDILYQGSRGQCAAFLDCDYKYLPTLAAKSIEYKANTKYAKYKVERHVQGEHNLGGLRVKDVICCDCGLLMKNESAKRKRCPDCAYKDALERKRMRMRQRRNIENLPPKIPTNPSRTGCEGCVYYKGDFDVNKCCNYFLDTGIRRPCPPGKDCTVKIERKRYREKKERSTDIS
jgi:hypothetical protein